MRKAANCSDLLRLDVQADRIIAMVRARVKFPFLVIKRLFGHVTTRRLGLAKNRAQVFTLFSVGNLFLGRLRMTA